MDQVGSSSKSRHAFLGSKGAQHPDGFANRKGRITCAARRRVAMTAWRCSAPERPVEIVVDGAPMLANEGEPLAAALVAGGRWSTRKTRSGEVRGPFCFIGMCQECVVSLG